MNNILEFIQEMVSDGQVQTLGWLILANVILGTVAALYRGKFELVKFMDFGKRVIVIFGSYLGVAIAAKGMADFDSLITVYWAALLAYMAGQILSNLKELGIAPIPDSIMRFVEGPMPLVDMRAAEDAEE